MSTRGIDRATAIRRMWAYMFSLALIAAVFWPVLGDSRGDSFPFSTYPMFSGRRSADVTIARVVSVDREGVIESLPPQALGTFEVIQAYETIRQAIRQGEASVAALCEDVAGWAGKNRRNIVSVAVVTDSYNSVSYFSDRTGPNGRTIEATCEVPR